MGKKISEEELINLWLEPKYGLTIRDAIKKYPEECKNGTWFYLFPVTQKEHDEWYNKAIDLIKKKTGFSSKYIKYNFGFTSLNIAPYVKEESDNASTE